MASRTVGETRFFFLGILLFCVIKILKSTMTTRIVDETHVVSLDTVLKATIAWRIVMRLMAFLVGMRSPS